MFPPFFSNEYESILPPSKVKRNDFESIRKENEFFLFDPLGIEEDLIQVEGTKNPRGRPKVSLV